MTQRDLITLAIIAFDVLLKDAIEADSKCEDVHPAAFTIMKFMTEMLDFHPKLDRAHQQYLINVAEMSADIKRMFLGTDISNDELQAMLTMQADRLKWLGSERGAEEALRTRDTRNVH